jgi:nucleotide-binding universal stress UspA family protein
LQRNRKCQRNAAIDTVIVGWDCSRPASRAVADSLPIAKRVIVVTVTSTTSSESKASAAALARNLAHHGIQVVLETVDADGRKIGDVLLEYVASRSADLLVMGAYGHSRLRETVFGGTTRSMLESSSTPILLAH